LSWKYWNISSAHGSYPLGKAIVRVRSLSLGLRLLSLKHNTGISPASDGKVVSQALSP
jgi:hypothetical protein